MGTIYSLGYIAKIKVRFYNLWMVKRATKKKMTLEMLATHIDDRFEKIEGRFEKVDDRFEKIDERFEKIDERFEKIDGRFEKIEILMGRGFSAVAEDVLKLATKEDVLAVHGQVNSIESQLRGMKHVKLESRIADVEEKVFGKVRA